MKVHVTQSKNGILLSVWLKVKNYIICVLAKMIIYGILVRVIVSVIKHVKTVHEKNLVLECEDETLNAAKIWFNDKKVICRKNARYY